MTKITANVPLLDGVFDISINDDKIVSVTPSSGETELYAGPTLFDIQVNGYGGVSCCKVTEDGADSISKIRDMFVAQGVGLWIPTVTTNTDEELLASFTRLRNELDADPELEKSIPGFHLEGPYLSKVDGPRGVHHLECIRPASWDEFIRYQEASGGRIRYVTLAPEVEGNIDFIKKCVDAGIIVALGHTNLDSETMKQAVEAGATLSTHLGNGAHDMIQRHNNYIWCQLASRNTYAAFVSDGQHLPSECLTSMIYAKGLERSVITSDCARLGGLPAGIYDNVEKLPNGRLVATGTPNLAGSASNLRECVEQVVHLTDLTHAEGWALGSTQAAKAMGLPDKLGIAVGKEASITVYKRPDNDYKIEVVETWVAGSKLFG